MGKTKYPKKARAHTTYELKDGTFVPGVTTITRMLNKPALVNWANNLGLEGIEVRKYVDHLADIGTLSHHLIECQVKGKKPDTSEYSEEKIKAAEEPVRKFNDWLGNNKFDVIKSELELVSEKYQYGGTLDLYCNLNGKKTLLDLKTSKACYPEHKIQISSYRQLLEENGYQVDEVRILRVGRDNNEGFSDMVIGGLDDNFKIFLRLREIYDLQKKLGYL